MFIPKIIKNILGVYKRKKIYITNQNKYKKIIRNINCRLKQNKKIRVGFLVMLDSIVSYKPLYKKMLKDDLFTPSIIVIPDTSRGERHLNKNFLQTYNSLKKEFKNVCKGYEIKNKKFVDFSTKLDMIHFHSPYDETSHPFFTVKYFLSKNVLPFYISYSFSVTNYFKEKIKLDTYSLFWKIFIENKYCLKELKKHQQIHGKNAVVTGYCKMDDFPKYKKIRKKEKTIILAPHHTVINWKSLMISNFLEYSDFFLKLPQLYPNIKFIFRPHPLLRTQLNRPDIWGEKKTDKYFQKILSTPNMTYSDGGDYFETFINSDAIIHDSASFLAEYLFTEKPECYILKNKKSIKKWFMPIGQKCLKHCYKAYSQSDIINFIDNVVLKGKDPLKQKRIKFVNSELKINYPNSSDTILNYIKQKILND